jgi:hypothetical protein
MRNYRINPKSKISYILATCFSLTACLILGSAWSAKGGGSPPTGVNFTETFSGICSFDIQVTTIGKEGVIFLPDGGLLINAPTTFATLTNLSNPSKSVTLNITGPAKFSPVQNSEVTGTLLGRGLFIDPSVGLRLLIGEWTYVFDANTGAILQTPAGMGQNIDVCGLLN